MLTQAQRLKGLTAELSAQTVIAAQALQAGQLQEAERVTCGLIDQAPPHPELLRILGTIRLMQKRPEAAIQALVASLRLRPDDVDSWRALSRAYEEQKDLFNALRASRRAAELAVDDALSWYDLGRLFFKFGDLNPAAMSLHRALTLNPNLIQAQVIRANILNAEGFTRQAEKILRKVVDQAPKMGPAWWGLAVLKPPVLGAEDMVRMRRTLESHDLKNPDRVMIGFALAQALEHAGDYDAAFAMLRDSNRLARESLPWNPTEFRATNAKVRAAFAEGTAQSADEHGQEVIFIVSMPRSGSTLVEQILASHTQVQGTTELQDALQVIVDESDRIRQPFPDWVPTRSQQDWSVLGQRYLARTAHWRRNRPRFTDKMPGNWRYLGAILAMLPAARVVVVRRDPLETCLGCYRQPLLGHPYTHDFNDLAEVWRAYDDMIGFWRERHSRRIREQSYEALQSDPEGQIRELLEFCDLPFEDKCLNFHQTERHVTTISAGQVREPIRRDTARAHKYGALLNPLREALALPTLHGHGNS